MKVSAYVTHGVLSGAACDRVNASKLEKLLFTNTIEPTEAILASDKFEIIKSHRLSARPCGAQQMSTLFPACLTRPEIGGRSKPRFSG